MEKTAGSTTTTYIGKLYVCDNGSCTKMIFAGGNRIAQKEVTGGATSYYHPDHLGSTSVVTDSAGNNEQDLAYYPYGDTFLNVGSKDVKFKYTGKERDDSTDLYFYEARYYDAFLGRFISADTIVPDFLNPQAFNRYSYVLNNPIIYTDPTGNFGIITAAIIGAAISATATAIQGGSISDIFVSAAIGGAAGAVSFGTFGPVASAATSTFGSTGAGIIGGIAAGAAAGLTSSVLNRAAGNGGNIGQAVGLGALSGALGGGIGASDFNFAAKIVASGLVGGGISELAGGQFATGFAFAAVTSAVSHYKEIGKAMVRVKGKINLTAHGTGATGPLHASFEYTDENGVVHTISAGPVDGKLKNELNRPSDYNTGNNHVLGTVTPPKGMTPGQYFKVLLNVNNHYCGCLEYSTFPGITGGNNSNGFIRGLIEATGGSTNFNLGDLVGGNDPVPPSFFGR